MRKFNRLGQMFLGSTAALALAGCDGADSVASPGAGTIIVNPAPAPTPPPTTPAPSPSPAATSNFATTTQSGITVTLDEQLAVFNTGTNNQVNATGVLTGLAPTGAAATTTPFNAATLNAAGNNFFTQTSFIGAVSGASDTSFQGWTCNSSTLNFGGTSGSCATNLARTQAAPATSACPTGTTAVDAAINNYRICRLPSVVTGSLSLPATAGVAYQLNGRVDVGTDVGATASGGAAATLTIAAGAVVITNSVDPANDFLVVNRGSRLNAVGTATQPIIFTSQQNLNPGTNGDSTQGQWGGIILLGRAPISNCATGSNTADGTSTTCEAVVEGTGNALYGGAVQSDNSGTLQFVQIRYSGTEITPGNELQGLTLGGTGSGTTINNVQVHNSSDDGIEIFGGTTNLRYIAITGADDDGLDTDVGWRGLIQFLVAAQKLGGATNDSFSAEIDSNGNEDALPRQNGRLANFTFIQTAAAPAAIRLRGGADFTFVNGIVRSSVPCLNIVASTEANGGKSTIRPANAAVQDAGPPVFNSVFFACNGR